MSQMLVKPCVNQTGETKALRKPIIPNVELKQVLMSAPNRSFSPELPPSRPHDYVDRNLDEVSATCVKETVIFLTDSSFLNDFFITASLRPVCAHSEPLCVDRPSLQNVRSQRNWSFSLASVWRSLANVSELYSKTYVRVKI